MLWVGNAMLVVTAQRDCRSNSAQSQHMGAVMVAVSICHTFLIFKVTT